MKFPALAFLFTLAMITCDAALCGANFRRNGQTPSICEACGAEADGSGADGSTIEAETGSEGNVQTYCKCAVNQKVTSSLLCETCDIGKVKASAARRSAEVECDDVNGCTLDSNGCNDDSKATCSLGDGVNSRTCTCDDKYFGTSSTLADVETFGGCTACFDFASVDSVTDSSCTTCTGTLQTDCSVATCEDITHTYDPASGTCSAPVVSDKCGDDLSLFKNSSDCLKISVFSDLACVTAVAGTPVFVKKNTVINIQSIDFTFNCTGDALKVYYTSASTTDSASFAFTSCHELKGIGEVDFSAQFVGECTSDLVTPPSTSSAVTVNAGLASSFLVFAMLQY